MPDKEFGLTGELTQVTEAIFLGESNFVVDPLHIILESSDSQKLKFNLIQWLAESPNRQIKSQRKEAVTDTLGVSTRQVERLLSFYTSAIALVDYVYKSWFALQKRRKRNATKTQKNLLEIDAKKK